MSEPMGPTDPPHPASRTPRSAVARRPHKRKFSDPGRTWARRLERYRPGLVRYVASQGRDAKVRPDMKIVFIRDFEEKAARLEGTRVIMRALVGLAEKKAA